MGILNNYKMENTNETLNNGNNSALHKTNAVTRFFRELFNKSSKCERLGHRVKTTSFRIRKLSDGYGICTDFRVKKDYCSRCYKYHPSFYDYTKLDTYTSVSMPTSYWDKIREDGYVIMD